MSDILDAPFFGQVYQGVEMLDRDTFPVRPPDNAVKRGFYFSADDTRTTQRLHNVTYAVYWLPRLPSWARAMHWLCCSNIIQRQSQHFRHEIVPFHTKVTMLKMSLKPAFRRGGAFDHAKDRQLFPMRGLQCADTARNATRRPADFNRLDDARMIAALQHVNGHHAASYMSGRSSHSGMPVFAATRGTCRAGTFSHCVTADATTPRYRARSAGLIFSKTRCKGGS